MLHDEILSEVKKHKTHFVTVTGGEPLAQKSCPSLISKLCDEGYHVSIETCGSFDIEVIDPRAIVVMDIKTPGSQEASKNNLENLTRLARKDQLKFVICSRSDFEWSREFIEKHHLVGKAELIFSPSYHQVKSADLAAWILEDQLNVRFGFQLHKMLWGEEKGR